MTKTIKEYRCVKCGEPINFIIDSPDGTEIEVYREDEKS